MLSSLWTITEKFKFDKELVFNSEKFSEAVVEKLAEYDAMDLLDRQKKFFNAWSKK